LRGAVSREEVPVKFKHGHIDPSKERLNKKGFEPQEYGWDPQGELATEFRRCRKRATAPPTNRFLFPETTAQENGWCLKIPKQPRDARVKLPPTEKLAKSESDPALQTSKRKEVVVKDSGDRKSGLGKWASESQLSATAPAKGSQLSALAPLGSQVSAVAPLGSQVSAVAPLGSQVSAVAPSCLSAAMVSELSQTSSWPGVAKELVRRVRVQDVRVETAMQEYKRYMCYGDRGNKHFCPLGETDATAYANAFMLATSGIPPHKWDPRN